MDLSDDRMMLACPGCGCRFRQLVATLQDDPSATCPTCWLGITVGAAACERELQPLDDSLDVIEAALRGDCHRQKSRGCVTN